MTWIQPKFNDFVLPPSKKQRIANDDEESPEVFLKPRPKDGLTKNDTQFWERLKPRFKDDLVVHKKKIEEVESWLNDLKNPSNVSRILLITGPSGCGKLSTVQVLCKHLGFRLTEWINPIQPEYNPENPLFYTSQLRSFAEFIVRATRYKSVLVSSNAKRIITIKDIPNVFIRDKLLFRECIEQYATVSDVNLIFIISDTAICRELFSEELKGTAHIKTINFNAFTQKSIASALTNVTKKLGSGVGCQKFINEISNTSNGDLRNAIMTLRFLSVKGEKAPNIKFKQTSSTITRGGKKSKKESSESYFGGLKSDSVVDIFHGLGRTLYAKKEESGKFHHNPIDIASSFESCPNHFVGMLQENYLNTFSSIQSAQQAANYLASADIFLNEWKESDASKNLGLTTAIYGLMLSNTAPVKRFQQFNKSVKVDCTLSKYKESIRLNFPSFQEVYFILDGLSYIRKIPNSYSIQQREILRELFIK